MWYFVVASASVWLSVLTYVVRLGHQPSVVCQTHQAGMLRKPAGQDKAAP